MSNTKMYKTMQEEFWSGEFGDDYVARNRGADILTSNINLFAKVVSRTRGVQTVIEFGANIGLNLIALNYLIPDLEISAIEINESAVQELKNNIKQITVYKNSIIDVDLKKTFDLVLIKGVLIHINPSELPTVYKKLYESSREYICIMEYYNPTPVTVKYRGHDEVLFKRDFAGEIMDIYSDLELVDYGFSYHRDYNFPQDDGTWFLLRKNGPSKQDL